MYLEQVELEDSTEDISPIFVPVFVCSVAKINE